MRYLTFACVLFLAACGDNTEPDPLPDAAVTALPPHEMVPDECLGSDCPYDAGVDAP